MMIYTAGYPRSGNTWLLRLLSDCLDCGWNSVNGEAPDYPGAQHDADYLLRKTHAHETSDLRHTIFVYRDPRDVAVSIMYYAQHANLKETIEKLGTPIEKLNVDRYGAMQEAWWYSGKAAAEVCYTDLHVQPVPTLRNAIRRATGILLPEAKIEAAINRQSFLNARRRYGESQYHHIRRGIVGDWRNHFDREAGRLMQEQFGELMRDQGFITRSDWWESLPEHQPLSVRANG